MVSAAITLPYRHGRYVLLREIARGGMAVVYHGKSVGEGGFSKDVAVKRMLPEWSADQQFIAMLIDEARVLTQLQHPNIVQVLELGLDDGIYFLAMEYIAGFDLRTLLQRLRQDQVRLPERFAYFIVLELLQGLHCAHTRVDGAGQSLDIVHRDISPHNILISLQGEVKIADFGIAKGSHRNWETTVAQVKGKYSYMAPEQARGESIDRRADVFAAGILLYEILTGQILFDGPNDLAVVERVRTAQLPKQWERQFHPGVRNIIRLALANQLTDRYPTAYQFYSELAQFVGQHRIGATRVEFADYLQSLFPGDVAQQQHACSVSVPANLLAPAESVASVGQTTKIYETGMLGRLPMLQSAFSPRMLHMVGLGTLLTLSLGMAFPGDRASAQPVQLTRTIPVASPPDVRAIRKPQPIPPVVAAPAAVPATRDVTPVAVVAVPDPTAKGRIIVQARPWGYVSIPGVTARRETPVSVSAAPGNYTVHITSGSGKSIATRVVVKPGQTATCRAVLGDDARASCR